METKRKPRSLFFALLLVAIGVFLLLTNLKVVEGNAWELFTIYWPVLFIIGGLDGLYRHEGWVGALVSLGLGTVLLLGNLGYLPWGGFSLLFRLWPVILIAWGLDVAFSHSQTLWGTIGRVAIGLILVGGIIWYAMTSPVNRTVHVESVNQPLNQATSSTANFDIAIGKFTLNGGADEDMLVNGTTSLPGNMDFEQNYTDPVDGISGYELKQTGTVTTVFGTNSAEWDIQVNPLIPMDLTTDLGVGEMVLDLSDTHVEQLDSQIGVGRTYITFPAETDISGKIESGVGETVLLVPAGSKVIIHAEKGLVTVQVPEGYTRTEGLIESPNAGDYTIELSVDLGVGNLTVKEIQ